MQLSGFGEEDGLTGLKKLKINKDYAKHYEKSRRAEELMKLKARYGDVKIGQESDSDSESEDEDAEELTPSLEQKWLRTLAALKSNDPKLYDDNAHFFDSDDEEPLKMKKKPKKKKEKKLTLKDMDRKVIMERDGKYSGESSDSELDIPKDKSYYEEQEEIRNSILKAQEQTASSEDDSQLLTVKVKTAAEQEKEEEEYRKFLKGQEANVDEKAVKDLAGLKEHWNREGMSEADRFLKDYILEKRYLADDQQSGDSSDEDEESAHQFQILSDDEEEERKADNFELKYNFRFEEPDPNFIKSYPRVINTTMRAEKNKRKEKRAATRERKEKEKQKKREELNRLKNLKKREIEDRLESIMKKSGAENMPFTGEELDEDFNPEDHDRKMKEMFPDEPVDGDEVLEKPTFEYDPEIDDNDDWDKYAVGGSQVSTVSPSQLPGNEDIWDPEDPNFNMDADYDPNAVTLEARNFGLDGKSRRSKRRKNRLQKVLEKKKPLFDPSNKTFEEYLDEYYGLECEDMIGDLKCRFPYREVTANDYGLSVGEILTARDKELNSWSSLKKTVQYRTEEEEKKDRIKFRRKGHDTNKKKRLLPSLFREENKPEDVNNSESEGEEYQPEHLASTSKDREQEEEAEAADNADKSAPAGDQAPAKPLPNQMESGKRKRKQKWKGKGKQRAEQVDPSVKGMSFTRMEAYGMHSEVKRVKKLRARDRK